jgi:pyridoxine kinase
MPLVLVISSYVAASRVGGAIAPLVLGPMGIDPVLVPASLFGRHPGRGPPGGTAVDVDVMAKMLEGVEADGLYPKFEAVITGHFSAPKQVALAAEAVDRIRASERERPPLVIVDPIMGDEAPGLYIRPSVAEALMRDLVPRADIVAPNLWEFARLTGADIASLSSPERVAAAARAAGGRWLVSSVPSSEGIGAVWSDSGEAWSAETAVVAGSVPNGTGDLLTLRFTGGLVSGLAPQEALAKAVGATHAMVARSVEGGERELPLAAGWRMLADPPAATLRRLG